MNRVFFILMLIFSIGMLLATESQPSATVGYFKLTAETNSWSAISIPFSNPDMSVASNMGMSFGDQDMVAEVNYGTSTTYWDGYGWDGDLANFEYGKAYWLNRVMGNATMDYYIMGTVNPQPVTIDIQANNWTAFALNEAASTPISALTIGGALDQDMIADINTGLSTTYWDGYGWDGDLQELLPTHAYWYATTGSVGFSWSYPNERQVRINSTSRVKK